MPLLELLVVQIHDHQRLIIVSSIHTSQSTTRPTIVRTPIGSSFDAVHDLFTIQRPCRLDSAGNPILCIASSISADWCCLASLKRISVSISATAAFGELGSAPFSAHIGLPESASATATAVSAKGQQAKSSSLGNATAWSAPAQNAMSSTHRKCTCRGPASPRSVQRPRTPSTAYAIACAVKCCQLASSGTWRQAPQRWGLATLQNSVAAICGLHPRTIGPAITVTRNTRGIPLVPHRLGQPTRSRSES